MKKKKYLIATAGKFHHFELAKAIYKKNQLTKIISGYPWFKLKKEGIPRNLVSPFGLIRIMREPLIKQILFKNMDDLLNIYHHKKIDEIALNIINENDDIDIFFAQSKSSFLSGQKFRKNGKLVVCDRTSTHINFQNEILKEEYESLNLNYKPIKEWYLEREKNSYENSDLILVPSNFVKKTFNKYLDKKIEVLEFGVNNKVFFRNENIKKSDTFFDVLFLASKSVRKGLHYALEAFEKFKHPNKRLHVVGSNTSDKYFFEKKLQSQNIIVYGHVNHSKLNDIINRCHVYVLPSLEDGFAVSILQVAAAGCPVIVTENTGSGDFVRRSNSGFVVPIRNVGSIVDKLTHLADNKELLEELSYNGQNYSKKNDWDLYFEKLETIIEKFSSK